jgi:hypothetical protein
MAMNFLRGLFGSSARQVAPMAADFVPTYGLRRDLNPVMATNLEEDMTAGGARRFDPVRDAPKPKPAAAKPGMSGSDRMVLMGAALSDAGASLRGGEGGSLSRVQEAFRKRHAEEAKLAQQDAMKSLAAQLYADDPEAQLLFAADPEAFVAARAERLKPRTMSGGQTYIDPATGQRYTAPTVEKFDDRYGFYDPNTGEARFSEARGPTFQEQTGRMGTEETARSNRANEGLRAQSNATAAFSAQTGRMAHTARERAGGYGTPGAMGSDLDGMSTEDLLRALGN